MILPVEARARPAKSTTLPCGFSPTTTSMGAAPMLAKRFFYVSAGILCLALAYHLGASNATAQMGGQIVGMSGTIGNAACGGMFNVITSSGEVFGREMAAPGCMNGTPGPLYDLGNFWSGGGPTPISHESLGGVKARYR